MTLSRLLAPFDCIDLIDLDVQGAELEVLAEAAPSLGQVGRLHVETHSGRIEGELPAVFPRRAEFSDGGIQLWRNDALHANDAMKAGWLGEMAQFMSALVASRHDSTRGQHRPRRGDSCDDGDLRGDDCRRGPVAGGASESLGAVEVHHRRREIAWRGLDLSRAPNAACACLDDDTFLGKRRFEPAGESEIAG